MRLHSFLLAGLCLLGTVVAQDEEDPPEEPEPEPEPEPPAPLPTGVDPFANATVFQPANASDQVSYGRTENLPNNTLLAAWSDFQANDTISIYRSTNNGFSWYPWGTATSDVAGRRLVQPHLLYVNETFGEEAAGTTLLAVNAVDDRSTNIELYASADQGESWDFVARIAEGGRANTTNGATPVWEPFLFLHNGRLICYYSDQRDPQHGQKLVQQTATGNFATWGPAIDVVASQVYEDRPGMATVAKLPNGQYIIVFEYAMLKNATTKTYRYPIYYKLVADPENAATQPVHELKVNTGAQPNGGPTVTYTPVGGDAGTIVVSDSDSNSVFINQAFGQGVWREVKTTAGRAYSREVRIPDNDQTKLRFIGGAEYGQETPSQILVTVMDLEKAIKVIP